MKIALIDQLKNKWGRSMTVHSGSCLPEMRFLTFGALSLYFAMQLIQDHGVRPGMENGINMILYFALGAGIFFCSGYAYREALETLLHEKMQRFLLRMALVFAAAYMVFSALYNYMVNRVSFSGCIYRVITFHDIPPVAGPFLTLAVMALAAALFEKQLRFLTEKKMLLLALLCLVLSLGRIHGPGYMILSVLIGSSESTVMPGIPYFAFFLVGMWFALKRPGFSIPLFLGSLAVTLISFVFYRSFLQDLFRVTASFGILYVMYLAACLLSDLKAPLPVLDRVFSLSWASFLLDAVLLFLCAFTGRKFSHPLITVLAGVLFLAVSYGFLLLAHPVCRLYEYLTGLVHRSEKRKTLIYFGLYTAFFAVLLLINFAAFLWKGRTLINSGDGVSQYYPRAVYFADYIRSLLVRFLHGNFEIPMYDFRIGLGSEVTYIMEPLYYLFALFGGKHAEFTYSFLTILRFYLAGIASSALILYFKKGYFAAAVGSAVYVFCGFAMEGGLMHTMFMVPMILMPLLVIATEEILRGRHWYLMPPLVAVSLFSNYYFFYMNTLGLGVYFLVRFLCRKPADGRAPLIFLKRVLTMAGTYALGAAMACVVLVTNVGMYFGSGRGGRIDIKTPSLFYYSPKWLERCFLTFVTTGNSPGEWLKLGYLPIALFAVVVLFSRKKRKEQKILFLAGILFMMFPLFGLIFSGFSAVLNRWCYLFSLLIAFITADCLNDMQNLSRRQIVICIGVIAAYAYLYFSGEVLSTRYVRLALALLILTFAVLLLCQDKLHLLLRSGRQLVILLWTAVLVACQSYSLYVENGEVGRYMAPGRTEKVITDTPLAAVQELKDDSFYRSAVPKLEYNTISSALMLDYNGITNFWSTMNGNLMDYLEILGSTSYSQTQLMGLNNSLYMNTLAGVKYYGEMEDSRIRPLPYGCIPVMKSEVNGSPAVLYENRFALPVGYTYDSTISEAQLEQYDLLERQEVMMQKAVVGDADGTLDDIVTSARRLKIKSNKSYGAELSDHSLTAAGKRKLKLKFEGVANAETYIILKNARMEGDMDEQRVYLTWKTDDNTVSYRFNSSTFRYRTGQKDFVINLGYHEEPLTSCTLKVEKDCEITFDSWGVYALPMDKAEEWSGQRKENVLEDTQIDVNRVSGRIRLDEEKLLVLSIPYQKGWTAFVDGMPVQIVRANYLYSGIPLTAGEHEIEMRFAFPHLSKCPVIMLFAILIYIALILADKKWQGRAGKEETD